MYTIFLLLTENISIHYEFVKLLLIANTIATISMYDQFLTISFKEQ